MKSMVLTASAVAAALVAGSSLACGEGQFNMGQGMRYQGYLAPKPATVLVYDDAGADPGASDRAKLYKGLSQAGHRVTVVRDAGSLSDALATKQFDVIIADFAEVDQLASGGNAHAGNALLLPVVERKARNSPGLRSRFDLFLVDGASLGQYLKVINQAVVKAK